MNKKQIPELTKITFDTSQANDLQDALAHVERDMNAFSRVVSSATNTMDYWQSAMKKIVTEPGTNQGFFKQSIMVNKEDAANVLAALQYSNAKQFGSDNKYAPHTWQYDIEAHDVPLVTGTLKLAGKQAFEMAQAEAKALGGEVWRDPTKKNPYRARYFYPADNAEELTTAALKTAPFKAAKSLSTAEMKEIRAKEEAQREKELQKQTELIIKEEQKRNKARQQEIDKTNKMVEAQNKQKEKERKAEEKERMMSMRQVASSGKIVVGLLTVGVSLLRRLVSSALQTAANVQRDTLQGHTLGMSYLDVRGFNLFDKAHGLPEGTSMGAIQTVQSKFGDITNLDENAIATLSRVMGSDVAELIMSGLGGEKPDVLLEKILDKYFEQFKQGKNSLGMYVGQDQARRELITSLDSVSSDLAKLLAQMIEDYESSNIGGFENFSEWKDSVKLFGGNLSEANATYTKEISEKYNQILASFDNLQNNFLAKLATSLDGLLTWISNFRIGLSETENYNLDIANKRHNETLMQGIGSSMSLNEESARQAVAHIHKDIIPGKKFKYKLPSKYDNFSLSLLSQYYQHGIEGMYELDFFEGAKLKDFQAWKERADVIFGALASGEGGGLGDEFFSYLIETEAMGRLKKESEKKPGEKIDRITFTTAEEMTKLQDAMKYYSKLWDAPDTWAGLPSDTKGLILPRLRLKAEDILSSPTQAQALFEYITDAKNESNPLVKSILEGIDQSKFHELKARMGSSNAIKSDAYKQLIFDSVLKHPELFYEYGTSDKERKNMFGMALENLPIDSINNLMLSLIAANNLPSDINTTIPYSMNWQEKFDKAGNPILTINFEQDGKIFGSKDVVNPLYSNSIDKVGTIVIGEQLSYIQAGR